jgi:hypothetical protein
MEALGNCLVWTWDPKAKRNAWHPAKGIVDHLPAATPGKDGKCEENENAGFKVDPNTVIVITDVHGNLYALTRQAAKISLHLNDLVSDFGKEPMLEPIPGKGTGRATQIFVRWLEASKPFYERDYLEQEQYDKEPTVLQNHEDEWLPPLLVDEHIFQECMDVAEYWLCPIFGDVLTEVEISRHLRKLTPEAHRLYLERTGKQVDPALMSNIPQLGQLFQDLLNSVQDTH